MSTTTNPSKATTLARLQALIAGTKKHFPATNITLGNATYTAATLVEIFQNLADAIAATDAAHASSKDAVTALRGARAKASPVLLDYKRWLLTTFGTAAQTLADFGVQPSKARTALTSEQKAAAAVKRNATRAARGTMGQKKKLAIKGNVTGVVVTPVTAAKPTAPTPATQAPTTPTTPATSGVAPVAKTIS